MAKKIQKQYTGGVVDDSLSAETRLKIRELGGPDDLEERISREIGRYRGGAQFRRTEPAPKVTLDHLDDTVKTAEKLLEHLENMPAIVDAITWERTHAAGCNVNIQNELYRCIALYGVIKAELEKSGSKKGEKPKHLEHALLVNVAGMIEQIHGIGLERAADYAAKILKNEGVPNIPNPADEREGEVRGKVRKYKKKANPAKTEPKKDETWRG